jgi:hypothetical protein
MIMRQLQSLREGVGTAVLSYTWFAYIDSEGRVLSTAEPSDEGNVIARMCRGNLVGNGSSAAMLTSVLRDVGGWDPARRIIGNEDYKTFFQMAERGNFAVVRAHLLGYRQTTTNLSSKARQMLTGYDLVVGEFRPRYPQHAGQFAAGRAELIAYLFDRAALNGKWDSVAYLAREAWAQSRSAALAMALRSLLVTSRKFLPLEMRALLQTPTPGSWPKKSHRFLPRSAAKYAYP